MRFLDATLWFCYVLLGCLCIPLVDIGWHCILLLHVFQILHLVTLPATNWCLPPDYTHNWHALDRTCTCPMLGWKRMWFGTKCVGSLPHPLPCCLRWCTCLWSQQHAFSPLMELGLCLNWRMTRRLWHLKRRHLAQLQWVGFLFTTFYSQMLWHDVAWTFMKICTDAHGDHSGL